MQNEQLKNQLTAELKEKLGDQYDSIDAKNMDKWLNVFSDEAYLEKLFGLEEVADVQALLKEKDLDLTEEEVQELKTKLQEQFEKGELSDDDMEKAAGGFVIVTSVGLVSVGALVVKAAAGAAGAYVGGKLYQKAKKKWKW